MAYFTLVLVVDCEDLSEADDIACGVSEEICAAIQRVAPTPQQDLDGFNKHYLLTTTTRAPGECV